MKTLVGKVALAALLALGAGAASAGVTVNYVESDKFSDLPFAPWERKTSPAVNTRTRAAGTTCAC
jgi:hypothetical protein